MLVMPQLQCQALWSIFPDLVLGLAFYGMLCEQLAFYYMYCCIAIKYALKQIDSHIVLGVRDLRTFISVSCELILHIDHYVTDFGD